MFNTFSMCKHNQIKFNQFHTQHQNHNNTIQQHTKNPRFPHKHKTIQCNHNNQSIINKENLVPEITTTTDTITVDSVPTTITNKI
jgi:hypothetical protein